MIFIKIVCLFHSDCFLTVNVCTQGFPETLLLTLVYRCKSKKKYTKILFNIYIIIFLINLYTHIIIIFFQTNLVAPKKKMIVMVSVW